MKNECIVLNSLCPVLAVIKTETEDKVLQKPRLPPRTIETNRSKGFTFFDVREACQGNKGSYEVLTT